ncbi:uncharacterized protein MONOS_13794 [Monocercomonoides exilis]|uniref:uncharacterized protein n=1 Tax=Monocercomonoides exilis TaxID=2049356 RepID=UPI003559812A|nr:hypothetical protein MONOS_13794 [Monocercomonoides exilis]|eukprot:MONOS_13794.1-p1 / transcript=MONOS_13794.1 / gene=MONOS_13794 / organism=Monocercomonoides_exilis_PA203 / gene_product=unspecified product / transcript_product=unspecified product / location=Mono_scaffold00884:21610-22064(+) / protein_length=93 / sequence_SO=supercontig / SO=protein_coding / is_pseudo=false
MIRDVVQLDILPDNVLICIFQHLDSSSIFALRQASKRLKQIGDEEDCWKKMCIEDIPHMISKCNIPQKAFISLQKLKEIDSMVRIFFQRSLNL